MDKENENRSMRKAMMFFCGLVLAVVGFIVIPPLLERYSNKIYKLSLGKEKIDFDAMGPEIVPHDRAKGE